MGRLNSAAVWTEVDGEQAGSYFFCSLHPVHSQFSRVWRFSDTTRGHCFLLGVPPQHSEYFEQFPD